MKLLIYSVLLLNLFSAISCSNNELNNMKELEKQTDALIKTYYPDNSEPGAQVLIMVEDSIVFNKSYGKATLNPDSDINSNTFFNIASVSKQFSAIAIMMLHQEGKLSLDDSVKKWFPDFKADFYNKITLRHLLSHTSGIPDSRDRSDRLFVTTATDVDSYSYLRDLDSLNFEPGSSYEYMNPTFQLMYTIIEKASGEQFDSFMKRHIFSPAGMDKTTYFEADKEIPNMAHGYIPNSTGDGYNQFDYGEESFFATKADGGIYTSVMEFAKWELALRNNLFIDSSMTQEAHSPKIEVNDTPYTYYGYGWFIERKPGFPEKIYHTGDNGGFQIYAGRYPEKKVLYLIFANRNDKNREELASKLDNILKANLFD